MEKQTKLRLIELVVFIIITFCISLLCSSIQYGDRIIGFTPYLGLYVGHMSLAIIISSVISLIYFLITKRFFRCLLNTLWITAALSFLLLK
jgi:hypothetical protein